MPVPDDSLSEPEDLDWVGRIRREPRLATALGLSVPVVAALFSVLAWPHGPATTWQALAAMAAGFAAGLLAGGLIRRRWAMLVVPFVHIIVMELLRRGMPEPSLGAIRLDNVFGVLALITGRGVYGLLVLLPMIAGTGMGVAWANRGIRPVGRAAKALMGLSLAGLVALAVLVAWPAQTPPIVDAGGRPVPGSIASLEARAPRRRRSMDHCPRAQSGQARAALSQRRAWARAICHSRASCLRS